MVHEMANLRRNNYTRETLRQAILDLSAKVEALGNFNLALADMNLVERLEALEKLVGDNQILQYAAFHGISPPPITAPATKINPSGADPQPSEEMRRFEMVSTTPPTPASLPWGRGITPSGPVERISGCAHEMALGAMEYAPPTFGPSAAQVYCRKCDVSWRFVSIAVPGAEPPPSTSQSQVLQPSVATEPTSAGSLSSESHNPDGSVRAGR